MAMGSASRVKECVAFHGFWPLSIKRASINHSVNHVNHATSMSNLANCLAMTHLGSSEVVLHGYLKRSPLIKYMSAIVGHWLVEVLNSPLVWP